MAKKRMIHDYKKEVDLSQAKEHGFSQIGPDAYTSNDISSIVYTSDFVAMVIATCPTTHYKKLQAINNIDWNARKKAMEEYAAQEKQ